jgi:RHS repeat-associated protein
VYVHAGLLEERIYLGGYEVYRRRIATNGELQLERQTLHVMDDRQRVAMVETKTVDTSVVSLAITPRTRYQLDNHLSTAVLELDHAGKVISYEEYFPYGGTSFHAADSSAEVSAKRYRSTDKEKDEETGLYYHGTRYYAPWLGRWTSCDPAGMADGVNLYGYSRSNPVRYTDSNGTQADDVSRSHEFSEETITATLAPAAGTKEQPTVVALSPEPAKGHSQEGAWYVDPQSSLGLGLDFSAVPDKSLVQANLTASNGQFSVEPLSYLASRSGLQSLPSGRVLDRSGQVTSPQELNRMASANASGEVGYTMAPWEITSAVRGAWGLARLGFEASRSVLTRVAAAGTLANAARIGRTAAGLLESASITASVRTIQLLAKVPWLRAVALGMISGMGRAMGGGPGGGDMLENSLRTLGFSRGETALFLIISFNRTLIWNVIFSLDFTGSGSHSRTRPAERRSQPAGRSPSEDGPHLKGKF